jgi:hypothetical protein
MTDETTRDIAELEESLRTRGVNVEVEVDHGSGASTFQEVADQYGVAYATETITWAVAWAPGPDGVTWQLQDREYLVTDAVHTAGTMGHYRNLRSTRPLREAPDERRRSAAAALPTLAARLAEKPTGD